MHRVAAFALSLGLIAASPAVAPLPASDREVLSRYLGAIERGDYARAFALLTGQERRYFGNAANFASIFAADSFKIEKFSVLAHRDVPPKSMVVIVSEEFEFFDHARQVPGSATGRVMYGLIDEGGMIRVKDPYHPWRAVAPPNATVTENKLRISVRKLSFFTSRLELVVNFANLGDETVTLLPYGRSVLRDDRGRVYHLIETKLPALTDRQLRLGLRLPPVGQYTGTLTFLTPDRFTPKALSLTIAPSLRDGADQPFSVDVPPIAL